MRLFRAIRDRIIPNCGKVPDNLNIYQKDCLNSDWENFAYHFPGKNTTITKEADEILENCFTIFGQKVKFDSGVDWNRDFFTQKHWPIIPTFKLDFRDGVSGDPKDIWELNRHAFLLPLAKAWCITKDVKYASKIVSLIDSWIVQCPPKHGINWSSCIELSIRQLNWIWALKLIADSDIVTEKFLKRVAQVMYVQTRYIDKHLSFHSSANNHLMSELCALVIVGRYLGINRWWKKGEKLLNDYLGSQILSDGTGAEQAPSYLAHTMEFYILSFLETGREIPIEIQISLCAGADYLISMMGQNGILGRFGDNDSGQILPIGTDYSETKSLINIISYLFNKTALIQPDPHCDDKLFWLLGEKQYSVWLKASQQQDPYLQKSSFPEGGYYILKEVWYGQSVRLIFDCGPLGLHPLAGHGHMDALSFVLEIDGKAILVDPGTYAYFKDMSLRNYFRSTRAHNTITIDDQDQSVIGGRFLYKNQTKAECLEYIEGHSVTGCHYGYVRLSDPVVHTRRISFDSEQHEIRIHDRLTCKSHHLLKMFFHFNPHYHVENFEDNLSKCQLFYEPGLRFSFDSQLSLEIKCGVEEKPLGWYSPNYNDIIPAPCLTGQMLIDSPGVNLVSKIIFSEN